MIIFSVRTKKGYQFFFFKLLLCMYSSSYYCFMICTAQGRNQGGPLVGTWLDLAWEHVPWVQPPAYSRCIRTDQAAGFSGKLIHAYSILIATKKINTYSYILGTKYFSFVLQKINTCHYTCRRRA